VGGGCVGVCVCGGGGGCVGGEILCVGLWGGAEWLGRCWWGSGCMIEGGGVQNPLRFPALLTRGIFIVIGDRLGDPGVVMGLGCLANAPTVERATRSERSKERGK